MGAISQSCQASWYSNYNQQPSASWASHNPLELTADVRPGRLQFNSLSGGLTINSLSFKFYKTNTGGGGYFHFYATNNASLLPSQLSSMVDLGLMPVFGSGTGWKTITFPASMLHTLSQFNGTWYLVMTCSIYVTFYGNDSTYDVLIEGDYSDGSWYISAGGIMKLAPPYISAGGVMRFGTVWLSVGGVMKQGMP